MFKRSIIGLLSLSLLLLSSTVALGQATASNIDKSKLNSGIVTINYNQKKNVATQVWINKGDIKYHYNLKSKQQLPLQLGDGNYTITVLEHVMGNKYKLAEKAVVDLKMTNPNDVFLQSIQLINWHQDMQAINKAKELTVNAQTDLEKVTAIYNYITNHVKYDSAKVNNIHTDYLPSVEQTYLTSQGVCYDYSALFAAMVRSVGVPTKLLMGRKNDINIYHAWNQVYIKDTKEWITIDTTYDAAFVQNNLPIDMRKNEKEYVIEKQY